MNKRLDHINRKLNCLDQELNEILNDQVFDRDSERIMDKLGLMAARIWDRTHNCDCEYDIKSNIYRRSMQRQMRSLLGMPDELDQRKIRNNIMQKFTQCQKLK